MVSHRPFLVLLTDTQLGDDSIPSPAVNAFNAGSCIQLCLYGEYSGEGALFRACRPYVEQEWRPHFGLALQEDAAWLLERLLRLWGQVPRQVTDEMLRYAHRKHRPQLTAVLLTYADTRRTEERWEL